MILKRESDNTSKKRDNKKMSKIDKKWENLTEWEKQKAYEDLSRLNRVKEQKKRDNEISIEKRIKEIKRKFLGGNI